MVQRANPRRLATLWTAPTTGTAMGKKNAGSVKEPLVFRLNQMVPSFTCFGEWRSRLTFARISRAVAVQRGGGPEEGLGCLDGFGEIVLDGGLQFVDPLEGAAAEGVSDDFGKEPLHLVRPRCRNRRKAGMEAGVFFQLFLDLGMLVRGLLVDNEMQVQPLWRLPVRNQPLEPAPAFRPMGLS